MEYLFILLILYCGSITATVLFEIISVPFIFKKLADKGYMLNFELVKFRFNDLFSRDVFIPFYNLYMNMNNFYCFSSNIDLYIDNFLKCNEIVRFTNKQLDRYSSKPTIFNIVKMVMEEVSILESTYVHTLSDGSKIYYDKNKINNNFIDIKKMSGPISNRSDSEISDIISGEFLSGSINETQKFVELEILPLFDEEGNGVWLDVNRYYDNDEYVVLSKFGKTNDMSEDELANFIAKYIVREFMKNGGNINDLFINEDNYNSNNNEKTKSRVRKK